MTLPEPRHRFSLLVAGGPVITDPVGGAILTVDQGSAAPGLLFDPQGGARVVTTTLTYALMPPWTIAVRVRREAHTRAATLISSLDTALKLEQWDDTHAVGISRFGVRDLCFEYATPVGQWVHLAFVGTADETRLYADGALAGVLPEPIRPALQWIGSSMGKDEFAAMTLAELEVYGEALTEDQVAALQRAPAGVAPEAPRDDLEAMIDRAVEARLQAMLPEIARQVAERLGLAAPEPEEPAEPADPAEPVDFEEPAAPPPRPAMPMIAGIHNVGTMPGEGDEYVEIVNRGGAPAGLSGYRLLATSCDRSFVFPEGTTLYEGERLRVYTNLLDYDTGGFSFDSPEALWDNLGGDAAVLSDASGRRVAEYRLRRRGAPG